MKVSICKFQVLLHAGVPLYKTADISGNLMVTLYKLHDTQLFWCLSCFPHSNRIAFSPKLFSIFFMDHVYIEWWRRQVISSVWNKLITVMILIISKWDSEGQQTQTADLYWKVFFSIHPLSHSPVNYFVLVEKLQAKQHTWGVKSETRERWTACIWTMVDFCSTAAVLWGFLCADRVCFSLKMLLWMCVMRSPPGE